MSLKKSHAITAALPLEASIHTPDGWKRVGDCVPGDTLSTVDGRQALIETASPPVASEIFRVTLGDGRTVEAGAEQGWEVYDDFTGERIGIVSTLELKDMLARESFVSLPLPQGLAEADKGERPLHPYIVGAFLSDRIFEIAKGNNVGLVPPSLLSSQPMQDLFELCECSSDLINAHLTSATQAIGLNDGVTAATKFVPDAYRAGNASLPARLDLLRGILDFDGAIGKNGEITLSTPSESFARDVQALAWSLGALAELKNGGTRSKLSKASKGSNTLVIRHPEPATLFSQPNKADLIRIRAKEAQAPLNPVVRVDAVGKEECRALSVDHPAGLLITGSYVVLGAANALDCHAG